MDRKYSIGLAAATICLLALLTAAYGAEYRWAQSQELEQRQAQEQKRKMETDDTPAQRSLPAQGEAQKEETSAEEQYVLRELNGYVAVYLNDQKTVFEYTNIQVDNLPEELQSEIQGGKILEGTEKLYGFLENYSS